MGESVNWAFLDQECLALAQTHGKPLFAYRGSVTSSGYRSLRAPLPDRVRIAYAVKANPDPDLLQCFAALDVGFDSASIGELRRVRALDLAPGQIFSAGPGKRTEELTLALGMGVRVQAEGWEDLERLDRLATRELGVNLRVHSRRVS